MIKFIFNNIIKSCFLYNPKMTKADIYTYFLLDLKNKNKSELTNSIYSALNEFEKKYVKLELKNYRRKNINNTYKMQVLFEKTEGSIKYLKSKMITKIYNIILSKV